MKNIFCFFISLFALIRISFSQTKETNWERLGPGGGGATFLPTFSYRDPNIFFLRCDMTGSYLTKDGGNSYTEINFDNGASSYAFDPQDSNKIYVGSKVLNRTADGGKTWQQIFPKKDEVIKEYFHGDHAEYEIEVDSNSLFHSSSIRNIHVDPLNAQMIFFSIDNYFYFSNDECKSFASIKCNDEIDFVYTNSSILKNEVYIFTGSSIILFDKTNKTVKEKKLQESVASLFSFSAGLTKDNKIIFYALHNIDTTPIQDTYNRTEVLTSTNLGNTWKKINHPLIINNGDAKPNFRKIVCAENEAQKAYLITDLYEQKDKYGKIKYWYGLLRTNDAGTNWNWVWKAGGGSGQYGVKDGIDVSNLNGAWASKAFGGEFIEVEDIGVYPKNGNIAVLTDWYRTMKTIDGGKTWQEIYSDKQNNNSYKSRGLDVTTCYGVHFDPFDSNHIAVSYTDIGFWHSYDKGKTWQRSVTGVPASWINTCYWVVFDAAVKNKLWSAWSGMHDIPRGKMTRNPLWKKNYHGGICVSEDGGKTWKLSNAGLGDDALITSLVMDEKSQPGNRTLYAAVYNKGVFKSTDDGKTWQQKNSGITNNTCAFELTLTSKGNLFLVISPTPNHKQKSNSNLFYSGAVYKSTDGAETWQKLSVTDEPFFPNGIAVDPQNADRIYLACWADIDLSDLLCGKAANANGGNKNIPLKGGIFLSEDAGKAWSSIFDQHQYVYDVTIDTFHKGRLYCNTFNKAAYRSDDYGKTWKQIKGYDFHWGHRIIVDQNEPEKVFITTYGSGVWHGMPVAE
jgi:photosystem II stability/assembly factor-like uncharacterized protein